LVPARTSSLDYYARRSQFKEIYDESESLVYSGAGRGMGVDIAKAARAAGNIKSVFATMTIQGDRYSARLQ
jgi:hypothetical protein